MHAELLDILAAHPDCYFQVFTNGHFITDDVARELRRLGNATPLVSVEGSEIISDQRRGRLHVLSKTMAGLDACLRNKVLTGVCTSLCRTNIDDLLTEAWLDRLIDMGVLYAWYHTYRPVGPESNPDLALTPEQQLKTRRFVVEMRAKKPIGIIDAYYDDRGQALCPAVTGISHHVSPWGDIEPCPIVQFATESIHDERRWPRRSTTRRSSRTSASWPPAPRGAASCSSGPTCSSCWSTNTVPATQPPGSGQWPNWSRWSSVPRSSTRRRRFPSEAGSIAW
jgi:MoaA/NifB/PqqE/SkfB family radical SAM enzyme